MNKSITTFLKLMAISWIGASLAATADGQEDPTLSVASYNIRFDNPNDGPDAWPHRADSVIEWIDGYDIIGLQEVTHGQLQTIAEKLDGYAYYGVGRTDGKSQGEAVPIFYRRDRFKMIDRGTIWLSDQPDQVGSRGWDAALPRTCTWMLLQIDDCKLWVANTHFDHRGTQARRNSAKLIRRFINEQARDDQGHLYPIVLTGDFNCTPGSDPYRALTADGASDADSPLIGQPLKDARIISRQPPEGPESTWNGFQQIIQGRIIDHIFVLGPVEVLAYRVHDPRTPNDRFASDHLPVTIQARIGCNANDQSERK